MRLLREELVRKEKQVLLAEDDEQLRILFVLRAQEAGYRMTAVRDGLEALRAMEVAAESGDPVDLLVTDLQMPGMSGAKLIEEMAVRGFTMPVLAISGHGTLPAVQELRQLGCVGLIVKPFRPEALLERMDAVLQTGGRPGGAAAPQGGDPGAGA